MHSTSWQKAAVTSVSLQVSCGTTNCAILCFSVLLGAWLFFATSTVQYLHMYCWLHNSNNIFFSSLQRWWKWYNYIAVIDGPRNECLKCTVDEHSSWWQLILGYREVQVKYKNNLNEMKDQQVHTLGHVNSHEPYSLGDSGATKKPCTLLQKTQSGTSQ